MSRAIRHSVRLALAVCVAVGAVAAVPAAQAAAALPACGSSDQVHNAPYDCAKRRTIDGTSFRVRLHVPVTGGVRVTFQLSEPRPVGTELHVQLRVGVNGPVSIDRGIQPAPDQTTVNFHLGNPCVVDGVFELGVRLNNSSVDQTIANPYVRRPPRSDCTG
jgi:hypothetical protein